MSHKPERSVKENAMITSTIRVTEAVVTKDVAAVVLTASLAGAVFETEGSARRFLGDKQLPPDRPDDDLALTLAFSRALISLSKKVERQAYGRIKQNDDNRDANLARKKAKKAPPKKAIKKKAKAKKHKVSMKVEL